MFQLLELLSKSTLIEILNNAIQQESGIHGMTNNKKRMTCYSLTPIAVKENTHSTR